MISIEFVGLLLGILTFIGGVIAWYRGSIEKQYAAQRDFQHLKANYQQITVLLDDLCKEVEEISHVQADLLEEVRKLAFSNVEIARTSIEQKALLMTVAGRWIKSE